jgi:hypothetical protein
MILSKTLDKTSPPNPNQEHGREIGEKRVATLAMQRGYDID